MSMSIRQTAVLCACLGLPPPAALAAPPEAPWDSSPVPFILSGDLYTPDTSLATARKQILQATSGFSVAPGLTLQLQGPICPAGSTSSQAGQCLDPASPPPPYAPTRLIKLGQGHLQLSGANAWQGSLLLAEGSLGLADGQSLGHAQNTLNMAPGTRLQLADGLLADQSLQVQPFAAVAAAVATVPAAWGVPPLMPSGPEAIFDVPGGVASWRELITAMAPLRKTGAGTLRLLGTSYAFGQTFTLQEGGLQVGDGTAPLGQFWFGDINVLPGTVLSGIGLMDVARVAGQLQPGTATQTGTLLFNSQLLLADSAHTRIRIDAQGQADKLWSFGTARLAGSLLVSPTPGQWAPSQRWTIVQADGGLDTTLLKPGDPSATTPVGLSTGLGRFSHVASTLPYLDPVLAYSATTVTLGLRFNDRGLNTADASWRSALLEDSRFARESALQHTGSGQGWVQTWAANTQRHSQHGLPGDDRDTQGLQLGISRALGAGADAPGATRLAAKRAVPRLYLAAFAGIQSTRQHTLNGAMPVSPSAQQYDVHDESAHFGLAAEAHLRDIVLSAGAAQSAHRAQLTRPLPWGEAALHSRARARLSQLWLQLRPSHGWALGDWEIAPWGRLVWLHLNRDAYAETGGLAATQLPATTVVRTLGQLGLRAQRLWPGPYGDAQMFAQASLRTLWGDTTLSSPQAYRAEPDVLRQASGLPLARHAWQLDLGVQAPISQRATVNLAYTGQRGAGMWQHGVWLGVRVALDGKLR